MSPISELEQGAFKVGVDVVKGAGGISPVVFLHSLIPVLDVKHNYRRLNYER